MENNRTQPETASVTLPSGISITLSSHEAPADYLLEYILQVVDTISAKGSKEIRGVG